MEEILRCFDRQYDLWLSPIDHCSEDTMTDVAVAVEIDSPLLLYLNDRWIDAIVDAIVAQGLVL